MSHLARFRPHAALCLLLSVLAVGPAVAQDDDRSTVTVQGEGTVTTQPDQAVVRFGVVTRAPTAQEARSQNATAAKNAMNAVRALDVPEKKMRMEKLRLQPRYEYNDETEKRKLVGYEAARQVVVEVARLSVLPQLVADVVQKGANRLDNIDYQVSDRSQLQHEALRKAARTAREKARLLVETLGTTLGPVRSIQEQGVNLARPQPRMDMAKATGSAQAEPEAYAAGEIEISAQVRVVFAIGQ